MLLAIALLRAQVIPHRSPILIAVSIPLHIVAFATGVWYVDPNAYAMLAVALTPAAIATLRHAKRIAFSEPADGARGRPKEPSTHARRQLDALALIGSTQEPRTANRFPSPRTVKPL